MEIILLKDVEHIGLAKALVTVKAGYARNYLIPQGLAIVANKANKNSLKQEILQQEERAQKILDEAKELATTLASQTLKIAAKAGTSGKIFGSVSNVQLVNALKDTFGVEIDKKKIKLPEEVKMLGTYTAVVALHKEVSASVKFEVYDDKDEVA
ncbi:MULTISPECIES: 50S ribosomal protein L9 [unclassified Aureispira]|uniref:50S ribosomal protein L9 n=1 Tax=unclassified Aureispira TaxID=2649989 RepID=UPI000695A734|nr:MULTISPECIES: 50S ribosomal protein L9 [unclassified Aureispira]WMX16460.1 50S ribosomal protein L9 [Aureispira sp. CCB-E]